MQLDQSQLVMRPRTMSEVSDLTLAMLRSHARLILLGFMIGSSVWILLDLLLLSWIPIREWRLGLTDEEATFGLWRYLGWMTLLVVLQTPIAGSLVTLCLGRAIFEDDLNWRGAMGEIWKQRGALLEVLMVRGLVLPLMLLAFIRIGSPASFVWDVFVPFLTIILLFFTRGMNPFIPEIILLEKCPVRSRRGKEGTAAGVLLNVRSGHLHRSHSGENGGRFILQGFVYLCFAGGVLLTVMALRGLLLLRWDFLDLTVILVILPASLWIVAGISVVVRLLFYLDTRLRLEGWDVELLVRAEVIRQFSSNLPAMNQAKKEPTSMSNVSAKTSQGSTNQQGKESMSFPHSSLTKGDS